jgi:hypothetical protein
MDINLMLDVIMKAINFIVNNVETIALIPLVIYYVRNQMWLQLFQLAVKESAKFAQIDKKQLSNEEKKDNVVEAVNTSFFAKFFNDKLKDELVESAYKLNVKE